MTIADWMKLHYKSDRFRNQPGFHEDRECRLIRDNEICFERDGYAIISLHDSNSGRLEIYGKAPSWYAEGWEGPARITHAD